MKLTYALVRKHLTYDPTTGELCWAKSGRIATHIVNTELKKCNVWRGNSAGRVIWLWMTGSLPIEVDHMDVDPFNDVWSNLRHATRSQNAANRNSYRPNKLKWAYIQRSGRYAAVVRHGNKWHRLGTFDTEQEAHNAAWAFAQQLHGPFARR